MVQALNDVYTACLCRHCLSMNYCILDLTLKETVFVMLSFTFHQGTFESPCIAKQQPYLDLCEQKMRIVMNCQCKKLNFLQIYIDDYTYTIRY